MTDKTASRKDDTSEYSSTQAPETKVDAEERDGVHDPRLQPGGSQGAPVDTGMASLDRDDVPNEARRPSHG